MNQQRRSKLGRKTSTNKEKYTAETDLSWPFSLDLTKLLTLFCIVDTSKFSTYPIPGEILSDLQDAFKFYDKDDSG